MNVVGAEPSLLGFTEFIYKHIIPACFLAPMKPTFDLSDAQTVQVSDLLVITDEYEFTAVRNTT